MMCSVTVFCEYLDFVRYRAHWTLHLLGNVAVVLPRVYDLFSYVNDEM